MRKRDNAINKANSGGYMDNKLDKKEVLTELKETKAQMQQSFDEQLGHIEVTKKELEELKARLEQYPQYVIDREVKYYHIQKKLQVVLKEHNLYQQLDTAIQFLDEQLTLQASRTD